MDNAYKELKKLNIINDNFNSVFTDTKKSFFAAKGNGGCGDNYENSTTKLNYVKNIGFKEIKNLLIDGLTLDIFGGSGQFANFVGKDKIVKIVTGDIERDQIIKSINNGNNLSIQIDGANMKNINTDIFDNVLLAYGFHHVSPLKRLNTIKESLRVLKPKGKLILKEGELGSITANLSHNFVDLYSTHKHQYPHPSIKEMLEYIEELGLTISENYDMFDPQVFFGNTKEDVINNFNFYISSHYSIDNKLLKEKDYLSKYKQIIQNTPFYEKNLSHYQKNFETKDYLKNIYLGKPDEELIEYFKNINLETRYVLVIPRFSKVITAFKTTVKQ